MRLFLSICNQLRGVEVFQTNSMPSLCATKPNMKKQNENQGKNTMNRTPPNSGKEKSNGRIYSKVKEYRLTD